MLTAESVRQLTDHITNAFEILHKVQKQEKEEGNFEDIPFSFDLLEKYQDTLFDTYLGEFVNRFQLKDVESYVFRIPKEKKQRVYYGIYNTERCEMLRDVRVSEPARDKYFDELNRSSQPYMVKVKIIFQE